MIKLPTNQLRGKLNIQKKTEDSQDNNRPVVPAGWHPQIFANQLTLTQPGGTRLCPRITIGTSVFPDLPTALNNTKGVDEKQACRPWGCRGCPQILSPQLTLSQPGGQIMPPHHYWHPRIFRPSKGPEKQSILKSIIKRL